MTTLPFPPAQPGLIKPTAGGAGRRADTGLRRAPVLTPAEAGELSDRIVMLVCDSLRVGRSDFSILMSLNAAGLTMGEAGSYLEAGWAASSAMRFGTPDGRDETREDSGQLSSTKDDGSAPVGVNAAGRGTPNRFRVIEGGRNGS